MSQSFDFVVIGGGTAGYAAANTARQSTDRIAVVDNSAELGGLCILRGCMPSKTLIYSAEVLHLAREGEKFGLRIPEASVDMSRLHQRKLATIGEFASYRREQLEQNRFTLYRAQARFRGPHEVELSTGEGLTAATILVATGSRINWPSIPGLDLPGVWTSDDVLDLDQLPESIIVLGGGVVASELAQFLARIGSKVTQIQRSPQILKEASPEAARVVTQAFRDEGMEVLTGTNLQKIEREGDEFVVTFEHEGETKQRRAQHLMNALGRKPATGDLNVEAAGLELRKSGHLVTGEFQQTTQPHIYAAGDIAGPHEIVHVAIMQGEAAAKHAFGRPVEPVAYDTLLGVIFTDPQIAHVGLPQAEIERRGLGYVVADMSFDDHGKSILMEAKYGYVKIWAEKPSGRILAAECVGKDASELIHAMSVAVHLGATVHQLARAHWYHPTLAEIWTYPIEDCVDALCDEVALSGVELPGECL
ncbi:MAG: dihydrolipoyl dehydrogenase family protein, partial [Opitutales bacterium]